MTTNDKALVEINELVIKRGNFVLELPRWRVEPGQVVGVVGPNGAGKTTLLEAIAGFIPATRGKIGVLEKDPWNSPVEVRSSLGFMSDDMPVFDMRVAQLLRMASGYYASWDKDLAEKLLEVFKIDPAQKAAKLSKGQGTRLRLILALAFRPKILVLDEPASGLDLAGRRSLLEQVLEVVRDPSRSVVISSHMLSDVERIADSLLVLNKGKVVEQGRTDELIGENRTLEEALVAWGAAG